MAKGFNMDFSILEKGLTKLNSRTDAALRMYAENGALKLQNYARANRKWTDRTGHARQRLTSYAGKISNGYRLTLAHGVDYGIWLELANEKKYSIIPDTIEKVGKEEILPGLQHLIERLSG